MAKQPIDDNQAIEWEEIQKRSREEERKRALQIALNQIPIRFKDCGESPENLKTSICTILYGGFGTGKTWASYSLIKSLLVSGEIKNFKFLTEVGLINEIKAGFSDGTFSSRMKALEEVDLLVVDEIGKSNDTDFNKAQLFEILNNRYNWMRRTVLICNAQDKEQVKQIIPTATLDRYRENVIHMEGKSRRYQ
jgi:DNA replication protein DnaC